jgi:hypothetical protein
LSIYVELEIQNLLKQFGTTEEGLSQVAEQLVNDIEKDLEKLTSENVNTVALFLIKAGQYVPLIEFVGRHLERDGFIIPWAPFIEALVHASGGQANKKITELVLEGVEDTSTQDIASRSTALDSSEPDMIAWRQDRKYKIHKEFTSNKRALLEQLVTLRTQQLYEQEKKLLNRLNKLYPGDKDIKHEMGEHKQRYAIEILTRRGPSSKALPQEMLNPTEPEIEKVREVLHEALIQAAHETPDLIEDLTVAAVMFEMPETGLAILNVADDEIGLLWLRMEVLLQARHYVEVLNEIARAEIVFAHEAETFFATAYLRAQAFWGLGQKHTAIEVMEGLLISRPHYRAGSALLSVWSQQ